MKPYQRFFSLLKHYRKEIGYIYMYGLLLGLMSLALPLGIQAIVNFIMMGQLSTSWAMLVIMLTIALVLYSIFLILQVYVAEVIQQKMFVSSSFEFIYRLVRIKKSALNDSSGTEVVHRFFEISTIQKGMSKILLDFSLNTLLIVIGLTVLSFYHTFFLLFSLFIIAALYFILKKFVPQGLKSSLNESTQKYELAHWFEEVNKVSDIFKINTSTELHISKSDKILTEYLRYRNEHFRILKTHYISLAILKVMIICGLLIVGSVMVVNNQLNLGQFIASEILVFIVVNSVEKLVYILDTVYDTLTAIEKLGKVMDLSMESEVQNEKVNLNTDKNLCVRFTNASILINDKPIRKNINFILNSGDRIALCGNSGSGKSILLKTIATLHPAEGNIQYNDIDINQLNLQSIRKKVGMVFSDPKVFDGTIIENISLDSENFDIERIYNICETVRLNEYIITLPDGYNTVIALGQSGLAKDIQLKIELARVLYKQPKIILFDSDLHYLTTSDKAHIISQFNLNLKDSFILYNTSSLRTVELCNKIIYMSTSDVLFFDSINEGFKNEEVMQFLNK